MAGADRSAAQETMEVPAGPVSSPSPQYPISLIGFDGSCYYYFTDCCTDGHTGKLASRTAIQPLGCPGSGGGDGVEARSVPLPEDFGPGTVEGADIHVALPNPAVMNEPLSVPSTSTGAFANYYGAADWFGTSVRLTDSEGVDRHFSLTRFHLSGTAMVNGNEVEVDYYYPVLCQARATASRTIVYGGMTFTVAPFNSIELDNQVGMPWAKCAMEIVDITVPDKNDPSGTTMKTIKCLLVNRQ